MEEDEEAHLAEECSLFLAEFMWGGVRLEASSGFGGVDVIQQAAEFLSVSQSEKRLPSLWMRRKRRRNRRLHARIAGAPLLLRPAPPDSDGGAHGALRRGVSPQPSGRQSIASRPQNSAAR